MAAGLYSYFTTTPLMLHQELLSEFSFWSKVNDFQILQLHSCTGSVPDMSTGCKIIQSYRNVPLKKTSSKQKLEELHEEALVFLVDKSP